VSGIKFLIRYGVRNFILGVRPPDAHYNMATASWRTCRGHDWMRQPKLRSNQSTVRQ